VFTLIAIVLNAGLQTACGTTVRYISARSQNLVAAATINFFASAFVSFLYLLAMDWPASWLPVLATGAFTGLFYALSYLTVLWTMKSRGMAIVLAFVNLSLFIPVVVGIGFGERPGLLQITGMAVTLMAVPMLSLASVSGEGLSGRPSWKLIVALFVLQGFAMSGNLIADRVLPEVSVPAYLTWLFLVAGCICLPACWRVKGQGRAKVVGPGMLQGLLGASSTLSIMLALNVVSATIFYCGISLVGLFFNVTVAALIWKERLALRGWIGIGLAAVAVVLMNL